MLDFRTLWDDALTYEAFLAASTKHKGLWEGIYGIARLPAWATTALPPGVERKLLVIAEDWCGDASSTVPVLAKLAADGAGARAPDHPARPASRGDGPLSDQRLAVDPDRDRAGRAVPGAGPLGPAPARAAGVGHGATGSRCPKAELYPQVRQWYARDHGETTLREVLETAGLSVAA